MPGHIRTTTLHRSQAVLIEDVHCRPECCECGEEEIADRPALAFVRSGVFVKHVGSHEVVADANQVVFFNRNRPYRVSHPVEGGDDCTALSFTEDTVRDVLRVCLPRQADADAQELLPNRTINAPAFAILQQQLRILTHSGYPDERAIDEIALALLERLLRSVSGREGDCRTARSNRTRIAHRTVARDVRLLLASHYRDPLDLAGISKVVHASPFHVSRIFRRETGCTVHKYLVKLRLRAVLEALSEGHENLTTLALELGFSSHSHLSDAFRGEFGLTPSAARSGLRASDLRKMSKNLEA